MFKYIKNEWNRILWGTGTYAHRDNVITDIYLRFYNGSTTKDYIDIQLQRSEELLQQKQFIPENPTVIYTHGFIETAESESVQVVISSYLETHPETNVIFLDWSNMAFGNYFLNAAPNTKVVAEETAKELKKLINLGVPVEQIHLIGHSLGGQLIGFIGSNMQKHDIKLKRLTALDPAFPEFYPKFILGHISAADAEFVDIIHTDAGMYGAPVHTGSLDFWPNGGTGKQPGCPVFAPIPLSDPALCSHWRSWRFWAESVRKPSAFPAVQATSYKNFKRENRTLNANPKYIYMGIDADHSANGDYYLTTNACPPYGKGMDGIVYTKSKKK